MNSELVRNYALGGLDKEITKQQVDALTNVGIDNITNILADIFGVKWTYEIIKEDILNINNKHHIIVTIALHTSVKSMTGTSVMIFNNADSRQANINNALVDAFNNIIYRQPLKANIVLNNEEVQDKVQEEAQEVIEETKEEIQEEHNEVEQTDISSCEEELNTISASDLSDLEEEFNNSPAPVENGGGIRKDQIEFLNMFKEKRNIDTDKKFNYYVKVWSDTTSYEIQTKRDLASASASVIDEFIKWVQEIVIDRIENREVVSPI